MRIAILTPRAVPFMTGGAEVLYRGLTDAINDTTGHRATWLHLPSHERDFWSLIESYRAFATLDLSMYDRVISLKYPAWACPHPDHHLYMLHCLRGLYDTWHLMNIPETVPGDDTPAVADVLRALDDDKLDVGRKTEAVLSLKTRSGLDPRLFTFPGALARKAVHAFDRAAMRRIKSFAALSNTVKRRTEYFPEDANVSVVYPAPANRHLHTGGGDFFFTASRLDGPKRIDLIIEAYKRTKTSTPLKIAGTGPMEDELRRIAGDDPRIEFLGFVDDAALAECYADAKAVIFTPYDEDYGYITIEAMRSGTPVITTTDSGGPTEFVVTGTTGLVAEPTAPALAHAIDTADAWTKDDLERMESSCIDAVSGITWNNIVQDLTALHDGASAPSVPAVITKPARPKLTVASTYPIYPPRGGGQLRIFHLYRNLSATYDIDIVSLVEPGKSMESIHVGSGMREMRVPKSAEHAGLAWELSKIVKTTADDTAAIKLFSQTPHFMQTLAASARTADRVIASHPYLWPAVMSTVARTPVHESHNVEYDLKSRIYPETDDVMPWLDALFAAEQEACLQSSLTTSCSPQDADRLSELYGLPRNDISVIPNGVDTAAVRYVSPEERRERKRRAGLDESKIALFMGSLHRPNEDAVREIFTMAKRSPDMRFLILGSVHHGFSADEAPRNVGFMGVVTEREKMAALALADAALNPMTSGSGTNLKMLDYLASGIPVITTPVGSRGLDLPDGLVRTASVDDFPELLHEPVEASVVEAGRRFVEERYDWRIIADAYRTALKLD